MVVRLLRSVALAAALSSMALLASAPSTSAASLQTFHLLPDMTLGLEAGDAMEVAITPIVGDDTSYWSRTMATGGALLPESGSISVRIKDANLAPPARYGDVCPLTISVGIAGERYVYWCRWFDSLGTGVTTAGEYTLSFELTNPDIDPIEYSAGDELYVWLVSTSSQAAAPSAFAIEGSLVNLSGTDEPVGGTAEESGSPAASSTNTTAAPTSKATSASPSSSRSTSGSASQAPVSKATLDPQAPSQEPVREDAKSASAAGALAALGIVAVALVARRRLP